MFFPLPPLSCFVPNDRRNFVRHLSRADAATEAIRIANEFIVESPSENSAVTAERAFFPDSIEPNLIGKTPSLWLVYTSVVRYDLPAGAVVDGGDPVIIVDLLKGTASWSRY